MSNNEITKKPFTAMADFLNGTDINDGDQFQIMKILTDAIGQVATQQYKQGLERGVQIAIEEMKTMKLSGE